MAVCVSFLLASEHNSSQLSNSKLYRYGISTILRHPEYQGRQYCGATRGIRI